MPIPDSVKAQADKAAQSLQQTASTAQAAPPHGPPDTDSDPAQPAPQGNGSDHVDSEETWEQRYRTLQGKYDSQMPRAQQEIAELRGQVMALQSQQTAPAQAGTAPAAQSGDDYDDLLGEQLLLDDDAKAKFRRMVRAEAENIVSERMGGMEQSAKADRDARFQAAMHPKIVDLQHDPNFGAWLDQAEVGTGHTRRQLMVAAADRYDVQGFNHWVERYLGESKGRAPARNLGDNPALAGKVSPRPSAGGGSTSDTISLQDWQAQYQRVGKLQRAGKREQAAALKEELDALYRRGRVVQ